MNAKELRIGNYVYRQSSKLMVDRTDIYQIEVVTRQTESKYDPIMLTEKWLYKFGASSHFTSDPQERQASKAFMLENVKIHMCNEDVQEFMFESFELFEIKTVHQLQNLYFALTGKELTLNK